MTAQSEERPVVALLVQGDVMDEVVQELLDHQGIPYAVVADTPTEESYPVLLVPRAPGSMKLAAGEGSQRREDAIVVDRVVDLTRILRFLSGSEPASGDMLEAFVNAEEEELVGEISGRTEKRGLALTRRDFWPEGAKACCVLTHDVDWLTYSPFHRAVISSNHGLKSIVRLALGGLTRKNYGWNLDTMAALEKQFGFRSSCFFMASYPEGTARLKEGVDMLKGVGFELGLHGAEGSHRERSSLNSEWSEFQDMTGVRPRGIRHHILKFEVPKTWQIASDEGFEYDATFSYNRLFGFRGGICLPYHPFSKTGRIPILELPTAFMDFTALSRGLRGEQALGVLSKLADEVERHHGVLVVNFHNTYLNRETFPDVFELYAGLLKMLKDKSYWVATATECVQWWNHRMGPSKTLELLPFAIPSSGHVPDQDFPAKHPDGVLQSSRPGA